MSGDGLVVAGWGGVFYSGNGAHPFLWTAAHGIEDLAAGAPSGTSLYARALSTDGTTVVGQEYWSEHAFLWNRTMGFVDLNTHLASLGVDLTGWSLHEANAVSADGK